MLIDDSQIRYWYCQEQGIDAFGPEAEIRPRNPQPHLIPNFYDDSILVPQVPNSLTVDNYSLGGKVEAPTTAISFYEQGNRIGELLIVNRQLINYRLGQAVVQDVNERLHIQLEGCFPEDQAIVIENDDYLFFLVKPAEQPHHRLVAKSYIYDKKTKQITPNDFDIYGDRYRGFFLTLDNRHPVFAPYPQT